MTQKERMIAGLPYKAWLDGLEEESLRAKMLCHRFNQLSPDAFAERDAVLKELLGSCGSGICILQPFHCDYGYNIEIAGDFFANYNLTVLDVAKVSIGRNVQCGPNVGLYTAGHPIHAASRNSGYEYGRAITIGDNVWLGAGVIVCPGVRIGDNAVIGAGSVVVRDIPPDCVAVGNPCRVVRAITEADRRYYCGTEEFEGAILAELGIE